MDATAKHYAAFRKSGMRATHAIWAARILEQTENREDIRLRAKPEQDDYFTVYGEPDTPREHEDIAKAIELWGLWRVISEVKCPLCGHWKVADSIGVYVDKDPLNPFENWYVPDLLAAALATKPNCRD